MQAKQGRGVRLDPQHIAICDTLDTHTSSAAGDLCHVARVRRLREMDHLKLPGEYKAGLYIFVSWIQVGPSALFSVGSRCWILAVFNFFSAFQSFLLFSFPGHPIGLLYQVRSWVSAVKRAKFLLDPGWTQCPCFCWKRKHGQALVPQAFVFGCWPPHQSEAPL